MGYNLWESVADQTPGKRVFLIHDTTYGIPVSGGCAEIELLCKPWSRTGEQSSVCAGEERKEEVTIEVLTRSRAEGLPRMKQPSTSTTYKISPTVNKAVDDGC